MLYVYVLDGLSLAENWHTGFVSCTGITYILLLVYLRFCFRVRSSYGQTDVQDRYCGLLR